LIKILPRETTYVTAATGIAAVNIGGLTLHFFAGIGLGDAPKEELVSRILNKRNAKWWRQAKVLIIDEVSMIDGALFDALDYIARVVRNRSETPFGGIQLICCGDFLQLPPVPPKSQNQADRSKVTFCFESKAWKAAIQSHFELTEVFRQRDKEFVALLNEIRHGICSKDTANVLAKCLGRQFHSSSEPHIEPTRLFALNKDVDHLNQERLEKIPQRGKLFKAKDSGESPFIEQLRYCIAPKELHLKVGAQVMLLQNLNVSHRLCNGARGVVVSFDETNHCYPRVRFTNNVEETIEPFKWRIQIEGRDVAVISYLCYLAVVSLASDCGHVRC
jgi:ATP-dependent DNA helicase PIF1